jgi:hypothetical protein
LFEKRVQDRALWRIRANPGESGRIRSNPGGLAGHCCLGGGASIGCFNEPGQVGVTNQSTYGLGCYTQLNLGLTRMPRPTPVCDMAMAKQTWNFQAWHRDNGGQSSFTGAISIRLRSWRHSPGIPIPRKGIPWEGQ